jgi:hypothetical protein
MGKSSGTQKTTTETKLPEWVNKAAQDYLGQARSASQNLMSPYQGQTVAAMTPQQQQSLGRIGELSNFSLTPEAIQGQMNPYIQNVEEAALAQGRKALSQNLNQISDAGIRAGGAFGSRQGILEGVAASEQAMNQANLSAQLRQQGYQQAVQNTLAGQQAALGSAQAGYSAGALGQQQNQAELAAQEAQYNAMRGYPLEQLDIFGAALGQTPYGQSSTQRQPLTSNPLMGALGGAMAFPGNPLIGGGLGFLAGFPGISDRSMKTDIEKVGKDKETGLNMYSYRYKGDPKTYPKVVGPMADEIQKKYPDKVKRIGGKLAVEGNFLMGKVKV